MQTQPNDDFIQQLLSLPYEQRNQIAHTLVDSLHPPGENIEPEQWRSQWIAECDRRVAEVASGEVETIPASAVIAKMRTKHGE